MKDEHSNNLVCIGESGNSYNYLGLEPDNKVFFLKGKVIVGRKGGLDIYREPIDFAPSDENKNMCTI